MMEKAPKSLRLHIGLFGRTNVGKSSFLNFILGQEVAITSPVPGTTTDVVEKTMELLPVGPVVFLDTAGMDDVSILAPLRIEKTRKVFDRSDVVIVLTEPDVWTGFEEDILAQAAKRKIPALVVVNKIDLKAPDGDFFAELKKKSAHVLFWSCLDKPRRDACVNALKKCLIDVCPDDFLNPRALIGDLLPANGLVAMVVPIDLEAPKGRLILPQVQALRDVLDSDAAALVVKEHEYASALTRLKEPPDLVVCDSQVVLKMVEDTPPQVRCTTFSILFSRYKGDLNEAARGAAALKALQPGDKVLIAEACSHHAIEDDIGRVKIPRWLRQFVGGDVLIETCAGRDFSEDLSGYKVVVHCGGCMFTRRQMLARIQQAREQGVALTNYGVCIAFLQGVLKRVLSPFPAALEAFESTVAKVSTFQSLKVTRSR